MSFFNKKITKSGICVLLYFWGGGGSWYWGERYYRGYSGEIEVRINPAKKDGNRSKRYYLIDSWEVDTIKKID